MSNRLVASDGLPFPSHLMTPRDRRHGLAHRLTLFVIVLAGNVCLAAANGGYTSVAAAAAFLIVLAAAADLAFVEHRP